MTPTPKKQMTSEMLDIFRAQDILDGRNGSKYIPKSYRTAPLPTKYVDYVQKAVKRAKNRKTNFMQRLARKINRMFN